MTTPEPEVTDPVAYPRPQTVEAGEVLYGPGDTSYDLILADDATVEIVQPATCAMAR